MEQAWQNYHRCNVVMVDDYSDVVPDPSWTPIPDAMRALEPEKEEPLEPLTAQVHRVANGVESLTAAVHAQTEVLLLLTKEFRSVIAPDPAAQARLTRSKPAPPLKRWKS